MVAPPWHVGVQHGGCPQQPAQVHGPLVPHVCQNLHLHQQVLREINQSNYIMFLNIFSAINPILYNALSTKFRRSFRHTLHCKSSTTDNIGCPTPSVTYLATTRLSTVSISRFELGEIRRDSSKPYVARNGLLAVNSPRHCSVSVSRSSSGSIEAVLRDTTF